MESKIKSLLSRFFSLHLTFEITAGVHPQQVTCENLFASAHGQFDYLKNALSPTRDSFLNNVKFLQIIELLGFYSALSLKDDSRLQDKPMMTRMIQIIIRLYRVYYLFIFTFNFLDIRSRACTIISLSHNIANIFEPIISKPDLHAKDTPNSLFYRQN